MAIKKTVLPPTYFLASLALMAAFAFALPIAPLVSWPWRAAGLVPIAAGAWLNLAADRAFSSKPASFRSRSGCWSRRLATLGRPIGTERGVGSDTKGR